MKSRVLSFLWQMTPNLRQNDFSKGAFTIYVYNTRWVGGQKSGKFVNVYSIKIVNEGRWVVKNVWKIVNVNCERPLSTKGQKRSFRFNWDPITKNSFFELLPFILLILKLLVIFAPTKPHLQVVMSDSWVINDYCRHGTGHGIGAYGFIHESPVQVSLDN